MAKTDNLHDFLKDLANTIRAKKGTSAPINPQNFSDEIASIETGGGGGAAVAEKDVNFRDYDGTILHSYTKSQFLALSELPELPSQPGLICQGWNWTLADAQSYVEKYGVLEVGAMYITDDGKTRLYIRISAEGRKDVPLYFSQTIANGVTIDWGDGNATQTLSGTGNVNTSHAYADVGEYTISLNPSNGCTLGLGHKSSTYCVMGSTANPGKVYCNMLQAVEIGKSLASIDNYALQYCYSLASVVIPQGVTSIGNYAFYYCSSLASVVIPQGVTSISANAFYGCYSLPSVVIPQGVTSIGTYAFYNCYSLASVVIPQGITSIGLNAFYNCYSLASVVIPQGVTSIGANAFYTCYSLPGVVIPRGVTSIGNSAFYSCYGVAYYDFTQCTSVPTLGGASVFSGIASDCKIVVPDGLYDSWIAATNWSNFASYIIKISDYNPKL